MNIISSEMEAATYDEWVHSGKETAVLVLSRKIGEKVVIGDEIVLVVKRILGQRVTFGIEAPESVRIVRGELPRFGAIAGPGLPSDQGVRNIMWPVRPR